MRAPRARIRLEPADPVRAEVPGGASATDPRPAIRRVAQEHKPEGGYGDTAYHQGEGTVCWVPADWTSNDELDAAHAAFMEIDGVNGVVGDAEQALPAGEGWETVWPVRGSEEAYERVLALATRPLGLPFAAKVPASAHYRPADEEGRDCGTCGSYVAGNCTMFPGDPKVNESYVCDDWNDARESA